MMRTKMKTLENNISTLDMPVSAVGDDYQTLEYRPPNIFGCYCGGCGCCCKRWDDDWDNRFPLLNSEDTSSGLNDLGVDAHDGIDIMETGLEPTTVT